MILEPCQLGERTGKANVYYSLDSGDCVAPSALASVPHTYWRQVYAARCVR
jgi:hypothetical protein